MKCALLIALSLLFFSSWSQQSPSSVDEVMKDAMQQASKENKNIFIIFHASWCGWCHKMDSSINDKSCKKFFDDSYVIRHLVAYESKNRKNLESAGVYAFLSKYNADDLGLPSWLIFDNNGNLLADSQMRPNGAGLKTKGENIGCPATAKEVESFIDILKKTSRLNKSEEEAVEKRFRQNEE